MKKSLLLLQILVLLLLASAAVMAQSDRNRGEFYIGYMFLRDGEWNGTVAPISYRAGFMVSGSGSVSNFVGIKGEFSLTNRVWDQIPPFQETIKTYQAGIQIKNHRKDGSKARPFAHVMVGGINGVYNQSYDVLTVQSNIMPGSINGVYTGSRSYGNSFLMTMGGGLDIKASERISIRAGQVDYQRAFGWHQNKLRISFGVVVH